LRIVIIASKESGEMETKIGTNMESYVVNYNNISLQEFKSCPFNSFSESNYHFPLPFWLENRSNKRKMLPNSSKCQRKLSQGLSQKKNQYGLSQLLSRKYNWKISIFIFIRFLLVYILLFIAIIGFNLKRIFLLFAS
jgi:hypothetical protein